MVTKRTPGKLRVCGGATPHYSALFADETNEYIVFCMADQHFDREHGEPIPAPDTETQASNVRFLAKAWNCHDELVDALKNMLGAFDNAATRLTMGKAFQNFHEECITTARDAIAKVTND